MTGETHSLREAMALLKLSPALMPHRNFTDIGARLDEAVKSYRMVFFVGPTGVGKTARAQATVAQLNACVADDPDFLRAAMVHARTKREKRFSFKELWIDVLRALEDPLPERKVARDPFVLGVESHPVNLRGSQTEPYLFGAVRAAARDRGLRVLFIDEAVPLLHHGSQDVLLRTLDVLRDLADGVGFTTVLVATHRLLDGLSLSPELSRRRSVVYFHRYRETDPVEYREYGRAVQSLFGKLPPHLRPKLTAAQYRLLLRGTTGCVGELFEWFHRAVENCVRAGDEQLRFEHFATTVLSDTDLATQLQKCRDGEVAYAKLSQRTFGADLQWQDEALQARADSAPESETLAPRTSGAKGKARSGGRRGIPDAKRHRVA